MERSIAKKWGSVIMVVGLVFIATAGILGTSCKASVATLPATTTPLITTTPSVTTTPPVTTTPSVATTLPVTTTPAQTAVTVRITDGFSGAVFFPETVTVPVGTTVTWWSNDVLDVHTITSDSGLFASDVIPEARKESPPTADETFSYTFTERGTFGYYCTYHPSVVGRVIVE